MANIESKVSVTRNGSDMEITSVITVPASASDTLVDYVKNRTDYWLENATRIPSDWQVRDLVNRLGLRDSDVVTSLIATINAAFRDAVSGDEVDEDSYWEEMEKAIERELDNLTDEEKGKVLSDYVNRNLGEVEYALENPCCCYGMEHVEEALEEIVMKRVMPNKAVPSLKDLEVALCEYLDETPPKQVTLEKLQAIVTAVFMGSSTLVGAGSDIGDEPSGWNPK